jgi:tetratricopeptide (TPR) repeat protein
VASRVIALLALVGVLAGCGAAPEGRASLAAGRQAMAAKSFREALGHFRAAVAQVPDSATAQQARGEAAEALGEFDEALEAYHAAARLAPSSDNRGRLGALAARAGQLDLAAASLEDAEGPWRRHVVVAAGAGATTLVLCATRHWPQSLRLWNVCLPGGLNAGRAALAASRERVASYRFEILVEGGRAESALALARLRGWVREGARYCETRELPVSAETAALLAMLLQPHDADCLLPVGARAADDGLVRLGRLMLEDRVARSPSAQVRTQAAWLLRYRLPATDPAKTAESLNVTGWRLQHSFRRPQEALEAYTRAIAADPAFSWPYHNIGRLYLDQGDLDRARHWLTKAIEVNPNHWRALFSLGVASHRAQRYDEALAAYSRAVAMNPEDADARANIGWILVKIGRDAEGLRELQAAVRLDPSLDRERQYLDSRRPRRP